MLLLPSTNDSGVVLLAERMRRSVKTIHLDQLEVTLSTRFSVIMARPQESVQ